MARKYSSEYKNLQPYVVEDIRKVVAAAGVGGGGGSTGVTDHGALTGLSDDDHPQYLTPVRGDARYITALRQVIAGTGLTGGGALSADVTLNVGAGLGITVNADDIALTTPGTLTVSSTNNASGSHTHAITSSSSPGAAAALLATTAGGLLTLYNGAFTQAASSAATFASGFAGSGWRADYGITTASKASIETDDLTVRGRMRVYELLIQQIRATNGSLFVSSASKVVAVTATSTNPTWQVNGSQLTFNGSNANFVTILYTISTAQAGDTSRELYHGFLVGDLIRAQQTRWNGSTFAGTILSNMEVTSVANLYTYTGAFLGTDAPAVGYDFVRIGSASNTNRQGSVYITSDDSAAPFIDIIDGVYSHAVWNSAAVSRVRVGKLTGISDSAFGGALSGYGLYGNNVYLRGQIVVTGGSLGGMAANDVNNNSTTINGSRITTGTVTANEIAANTITAGNIAAGTITSTEIAANTITASNIAANTITGNKLSLTTTIGINSTTFGNAGIQLDYNAGSPRFYAGNGSSSFLQYNGTNVSMTGFITATGGSFTGAVYCGSNAVRFSTDGQRLVLADTTSPNVVTSSSAFRWFAGIDETWADTNNYAGIIGYRHTSYSAVDMMITSYVGSTNAASYDARVVIQAGHNRGGVYEDANLIIARNRGTTGSGITATCDTFTASNNVYVTNNMSALSITDRTPAYDGDALQELRQVRGKGGKIDHGTLPAFARRQVRRPDGKTEEGRDIGAMISVLTKAVQELDARLDAIGA